MTSELVHPVLDLYTITTRSMGSVYHTEPAARLKLAVQDATDGSQSFTAGTTCSTSEEYGIGYRRKW